MIRRLNRSAPGAHPVVSAWRDAALGRSTQTPLPPMLARRAVRLAAINAITRGALTVDGVPVKLFSPGDWSMPADILPAIALRTGHESKSSFQRGPPQFTSTCALEIKAMLQAVTAEAAQDAIEALWYALEQALLLDYVFVRMLQQTATVETALEIRADGQQHIAGVAGVFVCEYPEMYDPTAEIAPGPSPWPLDPPAPAPMTELTLSADLTNVFDPSGTYPNPPFPDAVNPAPRTSGPDGRSEGGLDLPLEGD